jgi:hypothetical protein
VDIPIKLRVCVPFNVNVHLLKISGYSDDRGAIVLMKINNSNCRSILEQLSSLIESDFEAQLDQFRHLNVQS